MLAWAMHAWIFDGFVTQERRRRCKAYAKPDPEIFEIAEESVLRFAFRTRTPDARNFGHFDSEAQRLDHRFEQERVSQFLPLYGLQQLGRKNPVRVGHIRQIRPIES